MGEVKYGLIAGGQNRTMIQGALAASQIFKNLSGCWVVSDAAGYLNAADTGTANIVGWADLEEFTSQTTDGYDVVSIDISCNTVYRMPADEAPALTDLWECCDVVVATNVQQADISSGSDLVLWIMAINIADETVDVRLTPSKHIGATAA